jgi:hypothetical protein
LTGPPGPAGIPTIIASDPNGEAYTVAQGIYPNTTTYASINLPAGTTAFFITVDMSLTSPNEYNTPVIEPQINFSSNGGPSGTSYSASLASVRVINNELSSIPASQSWGQSNLPSSLSYTINLQFTGDTNAGETIIGYDYTIICWS